MQERQINKHPNLSPLMQDTVSFGVGEKVLNGKRMSKQSGININAALEKPFQSFKFKLNQAFNSLIANENHPDRPILEIKSRIKSPESIAEKGGSRNCENFAELTDKIRDLMGARLSLRDTSKESISQVLNILENCVKNGVFNIVEIENFYAEPRYAYVTEKILTPLVKSCEKKLGTIRVAHEKHPAGYTGVHFTIKMTKGSDNAYAELQLMGSDIDLLKDIEDLSYKIKCRKSIQKKYRPMMKYLEILASDDKKDKTLQDAFGEYTRQAYIYQRRRKTVPFTESKEKPEFLDIPWYLPQELDFKFLYAEMKRCDDAARLAKAKSANAKKISK